MIDGLIEFLLTRFAEDEAAAQQEVAEIDEYYSGLRVEYRWLRLYWRTTKHNVPSSAHVDGAPSPARVLAECDAKRRIVEVYSETVSMIEAGKVRPWKVDQMQTLDEVLHFLALPYADHPDYQQEWRP